MHGLRPRESPSGLQNTAPRPTQSHSSWRNADQTATTDLSAILPKPLPELVMKKDLLYWNQSFQDNLIETAMLLLTLGFLAYVIKLAFFEED